MEYKSPTFKALKKWIKTSLLSQITVSLSLKPLCVLKNDRLPKDRLGTSRLNGGMNEFQELEIRSNAKENKKSVRFFANEENVKCTVGFRVIFEDWHIDVRE